MIWAIDFDGTLCENVFPEIGEPIEYVIEFVKKRKEIGDTIILYTCRVDDRLAEAVQFCKEHGLEFDHVNENAKETLDLFGTDCRKIFAHRYLDDRNIKLEDIMPDSVCTGLSTTQSIDVDVDPNIWRIRID